MGGQNKNGPRSQPALGGGYGNYGITQPVPTLKPVGQTNSGGSSWTDPQTIGTLLQGVGAIAGAYGQYQNTKSANKKNDNISELINGLLGVGQNNAGNVQSVLKQINPGNDALMQFLRADPSRQFDTSSSFAGLEANDQRQINLQTDQLRAGYSGLGQRFGTAAQANEGRVRSDFASQIAARNAGIAQSSFESAQGRSFGAAQLFSQLASGIYGQGQSQNTNLLAILAGLPPAASGATAVGAGISDIGQLLALYPLLQNLSGKKS